MVENWAISQIMQYFSAFKRLSVWYIYKCYAYVLQTQIHKRISLLLRKYFHPHNNNLANGYKALQDAPSILLMQSINPDNNPLNGSYYYLQSRRRWSTVFKVSQLVSGRASIRSQAVWLWSTYSYHNTIQHLIYLVIEALLYQFLDEEIETWWG